MADKYSNYAELAANETEGVDYRIYADDIETRLAVIAIHAGGIETGTSELARGLSGEGTTDPYPDHSLYLFEGTKAPGSNSDLHITSTNFDEPRARYMVQQATQVLSVHGEAGSEEICYVGGLDTYMRDRIIAALLAAGFDAQIAPAHIAGTDPANICNDTLTRRGVQLELTNGLRRSMFDTFTAAGRWGSRNDRFHLFVETVREEAADMFYMTG
jgi:phage replication-related protein YjqB (UPF0714/DUF867 family)